MKQAATTKPSIDKLLTTKRKAVSASQKDWVKMSTLIRGKLMPLVIQPAVDAIDLIAWVKENRDFIEEKLAKHAVLLFRGFDITAVDDFGDFVAAASDSGAIKYTYQASPRHSIGKDIYNTTDYPPEQPIFAHNEHSFCPVFSDEALSLCDYASTCWGRNADWRCPQSPCKNSRRS